MAKEYLKPFTVLSILKPIVIQEASYYKDPHFWAPSTQVFGSFVPRDAVDVGMRNQQVDLTVSKPVYGCP